MRELGPREFEREASAFDEAVAATPGVDAFCSSSDWVLSARKAWGGRALFLTGASGLLAFRRDPSRLSGLDAMWDFACPIAAPAPPELLAEFASRAARWARVEFPGVVPNAATFHAVVRAFDGRARLLVGRPQARVRASLEGGLAGFLARRTAKFRKGLREAERRAARAGVEVVVGDGDLARIAAVERRSWKGAAGEGLLHPQLTPFYRALLPRLEARGALRVRFARRAGEDLAYIAGGVRGATYRGLQFGFDRDHARLGLGNLLQRDQIAALVDEGVRTYDLGIELPYKRRWGEERFVTVTLAACRAS